MEIFNNSVKDSANYKLNSVGYVGDYWEPDVGKATEEDFAEFIPGAVESRSSHYKSGAKRGNMADK